MKRNNLFLVLVLCLAVCLCLAACTNVPDDKKDDTTKSSGTQDPATCTHTFGEWTVVTEPTCLETGVKVRKCSLCHTEETDTVNALGHDLVKIGAVSPTDTKKGHTEGEGCSRCSFISVEPQPIDCKLDEIAKDTSAYMNTLYTFFSDVSELDYTCLQAADMFGTYHNLNSVRDYFIYDEDGFAGVNVNTLPEGIDYINYDGTPFLYYSVPYAEWKDWTETFMGKEVDCRTEGMEFGFMYTALYHSDTDCVVFSFCAYDGMGGVDWHPYFEGDGTYTEASENVFDLHGKYHTNVKPDNDEKYEKTTVETYSWDIDEMVSFDAWILPVNLRLTYENGHFRLTSLLICE